MKYFEYLDRYDVSLALAEVEAHPELWNTHPERIVHDIFAGTSDIWLRFRDWRELHEPKHFGEPHFAIFYPAWYALPAVQELVYQIMAKTRAIHLGGILLTRIPAGGWIKPHHDRGGWHAEFYTTKIYVPLKTNAQCWNRCEEERQVMDTGEAWYFNNLVEHEVRNEGETDRITLIVCLKTEKVYGASRAAAA